MSQSKPALCAQTARAVDEFVTRTQATSQAPSLIAGVIRDGALVHVSRAGTTPSPDQNLQYRTGSLSKIFTAAVVLGLRDEGRLDLDDPVAAHLPGFELPGVRVRQLLGQASGLQREPDGLWWERNPGGSFDELVAGVGVAKRAFRAYERFHYSNLGYGLLGGIVTRLTGTSWFDAVSTRILTPLAMARTTYHATEPFARGYVAHPWTGTLREEPREDAGAMAPAGQLWSTVDDLAVFAAAIGGAHPSVLSPATVAELAHPVVLSDLETWSRGYGLGMQLLRSGERVYCGHTGSMPGYLAVLWVHRRTGIGVVAFANAYTLPGSAIGRIGSTILDTVQALEPHSPTPWTSTNTPPPSAVEPLLGRWWWMGRSYEARWDSAMPSPPSAPRLVVGAPTEDWHFTPIDDDHWLGLTGEQTGEILTVLRSPSGEVTGLDIATFVFRRTPMAD